MPDYDADVPSTWQDCNFDYFFLLLADICFLSGIASHCMNPYFANNIKKPIERERENSDDTRVNNSIMEGSPTQVLENVTV